MPTTLDWMEIARRLALTVLAGSLVGLNRWERGRAAGLRTTVLVCLAASVAMIQTNVLIGTAGKPPDSFVVMDTMRLPLGILTGIGFIGAGAILRRGSVVMGVTTAATLWFVTVIGLCLAGGQIKVGLAGLGLCLMVLWGFRWVEKRLRRERMGTLWLTIDSKGGAEEEIQSRLGG